MDYYALTRAFAGALRNPAHMLDPSDEVQFLSLLVKRDAFNYEEEVRVIYRSPRRLADDVLDFEIDPNALFDEVILDPRLARPDFERHCAEICEELGYKGRELWQSNLYHPPKTIIMLDLTEKQKRRRGSNTAQQPAPPRKAGGGPSPRRSRRRGEPGR